MPVEALQGHMARWGVTWGLDPAEHTVSSPGALGTLSPSFGFSLSLLLLTKKGKVICDLGSDSLPSGGRSDPPPGASSGCQQEPVLSAYHSALGGASREPEVPTAKAHAI